MFAVTVGIVEILTEDSSGRRRDRLDLLEGSNERGFSSETVTVTTSILLPGVTSFV